VEEEEGNRKKKARGDSATPTLLDIDGDAQAQPQPETQEVKEVTKGVEEVDLQGETPEEGEVAALEPESVPLPEEASPGELDEPGSDASTPPPPTEVVDDEETSDYSGPIDASETVSESQKLEDEEEAALTTEDANANKAEETK
jgi:hypothetical protein